jgi:hypothetical protein
LNQSSQYFIDLVNWVEHATNTEGDVRRTSTIPHDNVTGESVINFRLFQFSVCRQLRHRPTYNKAVKGQVNRGKQRNAIQQYGQSFGVADAGVAMETGHDQRICAGTRTRQL